MEGETCQYEKFGYCKFQDKCKKSTLILNVKIWTIAKASRAAKKYTLRSAKSMPLQIAELAKVVLTGTRNQSKIKII